LQKAQGILHLRILVKLIVSINADDLEILEKISYDKIFCTKVLKNSSRIAEKKKIIFSKRFFIIYLSVLLILEIVLNICSGFPSLSLGIFSDVYSWPAFETIFSNSSGFQNNYLASEVSIGKPEQAS
jgi:hypothetical protein